MFWCNPRISRVGSATLVAESATLVARPLTPVALRALLAPARDPDPATAGRHTQGRLRRVGEREDLSVVVGCVRFRFRFPRSRHIYGGDRSEAGGIVGARGLFGRVQVQVGRNARERRCASRLSPGCASRRGSRITLVTLCAGKSRTRRLNTDPLERHQNHPVLEPTYNPTRFARALRCPPTLPTSSACPSRREVPPDTCTADGRAALRAREVRRALIQAIADSPDPHHCSRTLRALTSATSATGRPSSARSQRRTASRWVAPPDLLRVQGAALGQARDPGRDEAHQGLFRAGMNAGAGDNVEVKGKPRSWRRRPVSSSSPARSSRPSTSRSAPRRSSMTQMPADVLARQRFRRCYCRLRRTLLTHPTVGGFTGEKGMRSSRRRGVVSPASSARCLVSYSY
ncbi:hypothetical protein B0H14DRAFT_3171845, partial [Mycena olivaceomarginata]